MWCNKSITTTQSSPHDITRILKRTTNAGSRYLRVSPDDIDRDLIDGLIADGLLEIHLEHDGVLLLQASPAGISLLFRGRTSPASTANSPEKPMM